jgi:hypothetical protein
MGGWGDFFCDAFTANRRAMNKSPRLTATSTKWTTILHCMVKYSKASLFSTDSYTSATSTTKLDC